MRKQIYRIDYNGEHWSTTNKNEISYYKRKGATVTKTGSYKVIRY